jgi:hypothetical protein
VADERNPGASAVVGSTGTRITAVHTNRNAMTQVEVG